MAGGRISELLFSNDCACIEAAEEAGGAQGDAPPVYRGSGGGTMVSVCASSASQTRSRGYGSGHTRPPRWRCGPVIWTHWRSAGGVHASTSQTQHGGSACRPRGTQRKYREQRQRGHSAGRQGRRRLRGRSAVARLKPRISEVDGGDVVMNTLSSPENPFCIDEEAVFGSDFDYSEWWMEGPLLSPPPPDERFHLNWEEVENNHMDMCLRSYSLYK